MKGSNQLAHEGVLTEVTKTSTEEVSVSAVDDGDLRKADEGTEVNGKGDVKCNKHRRFQSWWRSQQHW